MVCAASTVVWLVVGSERAFDSGFVRDIGALLGGVVVLSSVDGDAFVGDRGALHGRLVVTV